MSGNAYYDKHTLYVKSSTASAIQIENCIKQGIKQYEEKYHHKLSGDIYVNVVKNRDNQMLGLAFVYVTNSELYNILLGNNPDASERYIVEDEETSDNIETTYNSTTLWSDIVDCDEKNVTKIPQESLINLPPIGLDNGKLYYLDIDRAAAYQLDDKYMPNILKCKNVHKSITVSDIKNIFSVYVTDPFTQHKRTFRSKIIKDTYPFVNINNDGVAFVVFNPSTRDAQFALYMTKITYCKNNLLIFQHSYRTDRDKTSDKYTNHASEKKTSTKTTNKHAPAKLHEKKQLSTNNTFSILTSA